MTKDQITATVDAIRDLMQALRNAATKDKAEIYAGLSVQVTYHPDENRECTGRSWPNMYERVVSEGGTRTLRT